MKNEAVANNFEAKVNTEPNLYFRNNFHTCRTFQSGKINYLQAVCKYTRLCAKFDVGTKM